MTTLLELYNSKNRMEDNNNPFYTDKEFYHNYITEYYEKEFGDKKQTPLNMLEIGMYRGGSIRLWLEWFEKLHVVGIDSNRSYFFGEISNPNAQILFKDAYSSDTAAGFEDNFFDYVIDDGPHSLESQIHAVRLWLSKVKPGGKIIIEDVRSGGTAESIKHAVSDMDISDIKIIDLTSERFWEYNVIVEITKGTSHGV